MIAKTPEPPYWAVIFTSERTEGDNGYGAMADAMEALATKQPGYLGIESARDPALGVTVSYWADLESIAAWKAVLAHTAAQARGREQWYAAYTVRVARVERAHGFERED